MHSAPLRFRLSIIHNTRSTTFAAEQHRKTGSGGGAAAHHPWSSGSGTPSGLMYSGLMYSGLMYSGPGVGRGSGGLVEDS